ncbi:MAG TPA: BON domain-containing protein [Gemmataceae bacterium]|nr:BON domain-containing protein [Gemmataceae bacterium]
MDRARRGAVGVLLAVAAVAPVPSVEAQVPDLRGGSTQPTEQKVGREQNHSLSEGLPRLQEMMVELALLADPATFPFYLSANAAGDTLELRGFVTNEMVRQHALDVARRSTSLKVCNKVTVPVNLAVPPPMRPAPLLQREAAELLQKNLGAQARSLSVGVQSRGVIVVAGPIDSVESKLAVSRLVRRLPGCHGVVNELIVQSILRDGQRVVQVTRDGSMVVPPAALGLEPKPVVASPSSSTKPARVIPPTPTVAPKPTAPAPYVLVPACQPERPQLAKLPEQKQSASGAAKPTPVNPPTPKVARTPPAPAPYVLVPSSRQERPQLAKLPEKKPSAPGMAMPAPAIPPSPKIASTPTGPAPYVLVPSSRQERPQLAKLPERKSSQPEAVQTTSVSSSMSTNRLATRKDEAPLPTPVLPKPANAPPKAEPEKKSGPSASDTAARLPVKWGQPAMSWESQVKKLEPVHALPTPTVPRVSREEAKMPTPIAPRPPAEIKKPHGTLADGKAKKAGKNASAAFAESRVKPQLAMTWRRPGGEEESEPKAQPATKPMSVLAVAQAKPKPPLIRAAAWSSRRWPPAYAPASKGRLGVILFDDDPPPAHAPASKGHSGVILFDDDPPPTPSRVPAAFQTSRPIIPANLQRQVMSICGRKARGVAVETQPDGVVLVKVKVASLSVEDQLSRKILAIPEMNSPRVRLLMDVNP